MSKVYFGITRESGNYARIVGVAANTKLTGARPATLEEIQSIIGKVKGGATDSLIDSLRDGTYPNTVTVWDNRADARQSVATLQSYNSPHFTYSVGEFGEAERKVTKAKGWRLMLGSVVSLYNHPARGADVFIDGDEKNYTTRNCLFSTRAVARKAIKDNDLFGEGYRIVRYDA